MLRLYFKTNKASFREQKFSFDVIFVNFVDWSKAEILNLDQEARNENETTLFSGTLKVPESRVLSYFSFSTCWLRY